MRFTEDFQAPLLAVFMKLAKEKWQKLKKQNEHQSVPLSNVYCSTFQLDNRERGKAVVRTVLLAVVDCRR